MLATDVISFVFCFSFFIYFFSLLNAFAKSETHLKDIRVFIENIVMTTALAIGRAELNPQQQGVLAEALIKKSGGLSLPMGFGKTFLSIVLGLSQIANLEKINDECGTILVVVSKTLLESWKFEIRKFFGDALKFVVLHQDEIGTRGKTLDNLIIDFTTVQLVLTTPDVISRYYTRSHTDSVFVHQIHMNEGLFNQYVVNEYIRPTHPLYTNIAAHGGYMLFNKQWGCLIVDEVQKYTNIKSNRCQGIGAICANHRWALSGTMFDEPKVERVLGYYVIINHPSFPRSLPDAMLLITDHTFKGVTESLVVRRTNEAFIKQGQPKVNEVIINHELSREEQIVYTSMKNTMRKINTELKMHRAAGDVANARRFGSYLMAMLCYLRQCVVCPVLPLAKAALDISDLSNKSQLSSILIKEIKNLGIDDWLHDPVTVKSSRIQKVIEVIGTHASERVVMFTCFRTCLDIVRHFITLEYTERPTFTLNSIMSMKTRMTTLQKFSESDNGVLLLTYDLGAEGLNLQCSNTVLMLDFWWNSGKTQQATARVLRYGQLADTVNIYYFMSNTGVEKAVFKKQTDKIKILNELKTGPMVTYITSVNMQEVISFIESAENRDLLTNINKALKK